MRFDRAMGICGLRRGLLPASLVLALAVSLPLSAVEAVPLPKEPPARSVGGKAKGWDSTGPAGQGVVDTLGSLPQLAQEYSKFDAALDDAVNSRLHTPSEVRARILALRYQEPADLWQAWVAFRAMSAAQNQVFAEGIRREVERRGRDNVLSQLNGRNAFVQSIPGWMRSDSLS